MSVYKITFDTLCTWNISYLKVSKKEKKGEEHGLMVMVILRLKKHVSTAGGVGLPAPHPSGWTELRKHRGPSLRPEPHKSLYRKGLPVKRVLVRGREHLLLSLGVLVKGKEGKWGNQIHNESHPGDIFSNKARWNHARICPLPTPHPDDSKRMGQQIRDANKCDCPWLNNLERADTWRVWWGTGVEGCQKAVSCWSC